MENRACLRWRAVRLGCDSAATATAPCNPNGGVRLRRDSHSAIRPRYDFDATQTEVCDSAATATAPCAHDMIL
jgi:hypothetical protein